MASSSDLPKPREDKRADTDFKKLERFVMTQATMLKRLAGQQAALEQRLAQLTAQLAHTRNDLSRIQRR